jgi:putative SOS response-associated peptidase YedK
VVLQNTKRKVTPMKFSLVPHWSAEPKVKFATHNARIETISEKPAWKVPFQSRHCLVPLSGFYESVYEGPLAGNVIQFKPKQGELLWAAGIFDFWQKPAAHDSGFFSFAILTREPSAFILDHGHDRTPIFVKSPPESGWLTNVNKNPGDIARDLIAEAYHPELIVEVDRPLKPGWEKRI